MKGIDHFISRAQDTHGNLYDYSQSVYAGCMIKIKIICRNHGPFMQDPNSHYRGRGCPECKKEKIGSSKRMTWEDFVAKAKLKHKSKYRYLSESGKDGVLIECELHGEFTQRRSKHLFGQGCPKCRGLNRPPKISFKQFIKLVGKSDLTFIESSYQGTSKKMTACCALHGEFEKKAGNFIYKKEGCPKCANKGMVTKMLSAGKGRLHDQLRDLYGEKYDADLSTYEGSKVHMRFTCANHGEFWARPNDVLCGHTCKECAGVKDSAAEIEICNFLASRGLEFQRNVRGLFDTAPALEVDAYIPEKNVGIEYCGLYWHQEKFVGKHAHRRKMLAARAAGIKLITIFEDEWTIKRDIVKSRLKAILNSHKRKNIFARKTELKVIDWKTASAFYEATHTQGPGSPGSVNVALYHQDKVVACMSFGSTRFERSAENIWEMLRFSTHGRVLGGFGKLFSWFKLSYSPTKVISYADLRWSQGDIYSKFGFELVKETDPNYFWCRPNKRMSRHKFMKFKLKRILPLFNPDDTEKANCEAVGLFRVFDCGHGKWEWLPC